MAWLVLLLAGLLEIGWLYLLKAANGLDNKLAAAGGLLLATVSLLLLGWALKSLPAGTAYAVWTGIGAVGGALMGILVFGEPATAARLLCIALIVAGIAGLKLTA